MATNSKTHSAIVAQQWQQFCQRAEANADNEVVLDGLHLDLSDVVSVSRYGVGSRINNSAQQALEASRNALEKHLGQGEVIYGVNTGFGGSADTRTTETERLQQMLTRELSYGILPPGSRGHRAEALSESALHCRYDLSLENPPESQHLPWAWVRAAILIRINSLIKGYSAVRPVIVERLQDLLSYDIVPMIPLRGSISASGDLNPLAYISGAIQGKATIQVLSKKTTVGPAYADDALRSVGLKPITLKAKEGLAIVNGTAISTAAGALALHDAHNLAVLAQVLTAMSVEALLGTTESFHPFFAESRPHPGQIESASNILAFLDGSKLAQVNDGTDGSLRQDRYSIRTASQWLGPALEDLILAHQQIVIECNSATDNPLIDNNGVALHGGNFQAKAVTSAMEKVRQAMQTLGRMLFTQCVEIINPVTNRGLPPNLVADDPSTSGIFKGTDIHIAALQAELGFLSAPVNHVQTAEMGNQALNSLALISARYTHIAINVLSELAAAHLVALCQALDLRAMHIQFLAAYRPTFSAVVDDIFASYSLPSSTTTVIEPKSLSSEKSELSSFLWPHLLTAFSTTTSLDAASARFPTIVSTLCSHLTSHHSIRGFERPFEVLDAFAKALLPSLKESWCAHRDAYLAHGDANASAGPGGLGENGVLLGKASHRVYNFVRKELGVPLLCTDKIKTPPSEEVQAVGINGDADVSGGDGQGPGRERRAPTVGSYTSTVYRAIRDGTIMQVLMKVLAEANEQQEANGINGSQFQNGIKKAQKEEGVVENGTGKQNISIAGPASAASAIEKEPQFQKDATATVAGEVAATEAVTEDVAASKIVASEVATATAASL